MIDTEAMRCKILENALKGQISDTLIADENVANLINLLRMQKEECIKKGLISKDKKALPITEKETPFQIPAAWSWVRIGDIFYHNTGKALNSSNTEGNTYEYITTSNVYWDRFELNELKTMLFTESEIEKCTVKKGDLLVCEGGDIGRAAIWNFDEEIKIQNHIHRLRPYVEICVRFYYYVFLYYKKIGRINGKGIGLQGLSTNVLHELIVPLPPRGIQWKIAEKIDEIFEQLEIIDELQRNYVADIKALKNKLFDVAVQGKLSEQLLEDGTAEELYTKIQIEKTALMQEGKIKKEKALPEIIEEDMPFDIPKNWKWVRLGEISWFQGGYAFKSNLYVEDSDNQIIRLGNVKQNALLLDARPVFISDELASEVEDYRIRENDILITMTGTRRKKDYFYAKCVEQSDLQGKKLYLNQRVGCIRVVDGVYPQFLVIALRNTEIRKIIFERETGAVNQGNLGSEDIKKFVYIPLPPYAEQIRIVEKIREVISCGQIMHLK